MTTTVFTVVGEYGKMPERKSPSAAGFDIYAAEGRVLMPGAPALVKTRVRVEIPEGFYGQIGSRSGLMFKKSIMAFPGVIDSGYRGELGIILLNLGDALQTVDWGHRIAQLIILPLAPEVQFSRCDRLVPSARGEGGFGSTGE